MTYDDHLSTSISQKILTCTEALGELNDVDSILDRVLYFARALTQSEAGSIYLVKHGELEFSYVQNDKLYQKNVPHQDLYANATLPIDETSIVGYAAKTGETVLVDDVYAISSTVPYRFNDLHDSRTGYHTQSMITVPLRSVQGNLVGVLQIINRKTPEGNIIGFDPETQAIIAVLASHAAAAIERGLMTRELILRMVKMAQLRDPGETGAHVLRVGSYSAEIFKHWAHKKISQSQLFHSSWDTLEKAELERQIRNSADMLRLAAMLHDVGKVGISDAILKKPARLSPEEYNIMKWHTVYGARLFDNPTSKLDVMCRDVALSHHEKWDGTGYPGKNPEGLSKSATIVARRKREISIEARVVALADVYDALCSARSYKEPWPEQKITDEIEKQNGLHFDPDLVESFFEIQDVLLAIRQKFTETDFRESQF